MAASGSGVVVRIAARQDQIDRATRELRNVRNGVPRALSAAVNKTARGAKTDTVREIGTRYTVKKAAIREAISLGRRASPANPSASILGRYKAISLINFKVRPKSVGKRRPRAGIQVQVKVGSSSRLQHAFISPLGGNPHVTQRVGAGRLPIEKLHGPAVAQMMDSDGVREEVLTKANQRLGQYLDHEITRLEAGHGR